MSGLVDDFCVFMMLYLALYPCYSYDLDILNLSRSILIHITKILNTLVHHNVLYIKQVFDKDIQKGFWFGPSASICRCEPILFLISGFPEAAEVGKRICIW